LTTVNVSDVYDQEELDKRVKAAAFIGTVQAAYTDFHYLRDSWRKVTEKDALIGVSMTGIASGGVMNLDLKRAAQVVKEENARVAKMLGINPAARTTCVKPEGTASIILGTSSGIHAWHDQYYIRRVRVGKNEAIYPYLKEVAPEMLEDELFNPSAQAVISVPQKAPEGAITRDEDVMEMLERVRKFNVEWVQEGHRSGQNTNNVSATVSIGQGEWEKVGEWMWEHRHSFNGLSVLPKDLGTYKQAPFETCTKEEYERLLGTLKSLDLSKVVEEVDNTDLSGEIACGGGSCEVI
jgi:ribonucleoside-diphosphate reductase alpha chain